MCTLLVLLDFSRIFDYINVTLLFPKLRYYSFLQKNQFVKLQSSDGSFTTFIKLTVTRGVPQGSILGPILFILNSANIVLYSTNSTFHIYIDNTQIYISFKLAEMDSAINKLNAELKRIALRSKLNCLVLNSSKTKYLNFGSKSSLKI